MSSSSAPRFGGWTRLRVCQLALGERNLRTYPVAQYRYYVFSPVSTHKFRGYYGSELPGATSMRYYLDRTTGDFYRYTGQGWQPLPRTAPAQVYAALSVSHSLSDGNHRLRSQAGR